MEGYCSTGQSPQRAVVPVEEEEEEEEEKEEKEEEEEEEKKKKKILSGFYIMICSHLYLLLPYVL
jgi:ribosomal protein L12E/L44/L45/RPP1/RPP2